MRPPIIITHVEAVQTAVIRGCVSRKELPKFIPAACGEVWTFVRSAGLPKPGRHVALYVDAQDTIEVGAEVSGPFAGNDRVQCSQLPAGRVATTVHFGPYSTLSQTHAGIRQWCQEHGHSLSPISWEIYGHWEERWNADPSMIRTDVFYLLHEVQK